MKKLIALLLALTMCFALAACGGSGSSSSTPAAEEPAAEAPAAEAPAAEEPAAEEPAAAPDAGIDPLEIKFSTTYSEIETGGVILHHFIDKLDELSGGAITVNVAWGGTLFDTMGELDALMDGVVDMIMFSHMPHLDTVPLMSFPGFAPGGSQAALDFFDEIMFNDPETSALIQGEAEALGIKYLNVTAGGANAMCATYPFDSLAALAAGSTTFGNADAAIWEAQGMNVSAIFPPDVYQALDTGLINGTSMALAPMTAMAWYEVAPYWALDGTYAAGNMFSVNLDWWDGLTDAQRECIQAAADDVEDFSATLYDDSIAEDIATIENATGNKFAELSDEDLAYFWSLVFEAKADDAIARAKTHDCLDDMVVILEKAAEVTGYDWSYEG